MACMKRAVLVIAIVALVLACGFVGCSKLSELTSTVDQKLSPAVQKVKELLPSPDDKGDEAVYEDSEEQADETEASSGWSLPSVGNFSASVLNSTDDVVLVPTDDYASGYVFDYDGQQFVAYFDQYSWRVYDSYKITNHDDIVTICQALINEHPVYGSDWESFRTADDMAYEWEQHNLAYELLPEDSHWREDVKDVDLDPYDQGKSLQEMYEGRTGQPFDLRNYLPG